MIKKNVDNGDRIGINNGTSCILQSVILDPLEAPFDTNPFLPPRLLKHMPTLIVKPRVQRHRDLTGLHSGELPLKKTDTLPFLWPPGAVKKLDAIAQIVRTQLPIACEWARTGQQAQGGTYRPAVIHLTSSNEFAMNYVLLSRGITIEDLAVLTQFDPAILKKKPPDTVQKELQRLRTLERRHLQSYFAQNPRFRSESLAEARQ